MTYFVAHNETTGKTSKAFMSLGEAQDYLAELCSAGDEYTIAKHDQSLKRLEIVEQGVFDAQHPNRRKDDQRDN